MALPPPFKGSDPFLIYPLAIVCAALACLYQHPSKLTTDNEPAPVLLQVSEQPSEVYNCVYCLRLKGEVCRHRSMLRLNHSFLTRIAYTGFGYHFLGFRCCAYIPSALKSRVVQALLQNTHAQKKPTPLRAGFSWF